MTGLRSSLFTITLTFIGAMSPAACAAASGDDIQPDEGGTDAAQQQQGTGSTTGAGAVGSTGGSSAGGGSAGGSGGSGSASGGATGSGGTGGLSLDPAAILFEEDFESAANETVPAGWDSFVSYVVNMSNTPNSTAFALADTSKAHSGSMALHVKGGTSPAMLTRPLPAGTNKIYMRAYVWMTQSMGQGVGRNHETLLGVRGTPGGANDEVRFGEIKGVIGTNEVPSDDISPTMDQWEKGPLIPAGTWNCIEVAFLGDSANHEVQAWNDGVEVHRVNDPAQWNNKGLGANFLDNNFVEFMIGWHSFSNYDNEIWFDDIIVATERVGCE